MIKEKIETVCNELSNRHPWFMLAKNGKTKKIQVAAYLNDIRYILAQTPRHLALVSKTAKLQKKTNLSNFYHEKIKEEIGHEKWAESDLVCLGATEFKNTPPRQSAVRLMKFLDQDVVENPSNYLLYMCFVEFLTLTAGAQWVGDIVNNCHIDPNSISAIGNHIIVDKDHVDEDYEMIAQEISGEIEVLNALKYIDALYPLIHRFFIEMAEEVYVPQRAHSINL